MTGISALAKGALPYILVVLATMSGLGLMVDSLARSSATYDEVAYLQIAADWWRTGRQERITRMGSPLTFWKIQQAPVLWTLDRVGKRELVDRPTENQAALLPIARLGSLWIWGLALALTAAWARRQWGPWAMAFAAWLFALSPNLLAHGALVTMELPLVAAMTGAFMLFERFLRNGRLRWFCASALLSGAAFSCKFTAILTLPILGIAWWLERCLAGERRFLRLTVRVGIGMLGFGAAMALADLVVTGFALLPLSESRGPHPLVSGRAGSLSTVLGRLLETPIPQDWVGFARQMTHQRSGGPSYLLGERRMKGWWYYSFVCLAVKVPPSFWCLVIGRALLGRGRPRDTGERLILVSIFVFITIVCLGSSRNYGFRYLLPLAPLAIVWVSAVAEWGRWGRALACAALVGQSAALLSIHPHELSYFNVLAGGPAGGRFLLADSNLDWGQGARALARLQTQHPEYRDITVYYFGDTDPGHYGVVGTRYVIDAGTSHPGFPPSFDPQTGYVAVSTSLQYGPWGPAKYFAKLEGVQPVALLEDHTMAIYRTSAIASKAR